MVRRNPRPPSEHTADRPFAPFAIEIGELTRSWNIFQENLGEIFAWIVNDLNPNIPLAVWYSTQNDRAQREMLRRAYASFGAVNNRQHPKAKEDIKWLLDRCDSLAEQRNDALHAPLMLAISEPNKTIEVVPAYFLGNPRAIKLKNKNILEELRWYRESAETLRQYALSISFHLRTDGTSWPERPLMPTLGQTHRRKPSNRKNTPKSPRPPPRSSRT
jgi:hypothetical protein